MVRIYPSISSWDLYVRVKKLSGMSVSRSPLIPFTSLSDLDSTVSSEDLVHCEYV